MVEFELKFKLSYAIAVSLISILAGTTVKLRQRRSQRSQHTGRPRRHDKKK